MPLEEENLETVDQREDPWQRASAEELAEADAYILEKYGVPA